MAEMKPTSAKPVTLIALRHGGTHLIQPIIRHMTGKPVYVPKGSDALTCTPSPKLVVFFRDPRNRMVSQLRYKNGKGIRPSPGNDERLAAMLSTPKMGTTPLDYMWAWAQRWHRSGLQVRFEVLMEDPLGQAARIAEYLDAPGDPAAAVEYTLGKSGTWTGTHSAWQEWFGPKTRAAWARGGGAEILHLMGYGDADECLL